MTGDTGIFTAYISKKGMAKAIRKKSAAKKTVTKKGTLGKNKWGVKNSLVNNINARKKKGKSRSKKNSTVSKKAYRKMEDHWGK